MKNLLKVNLQLFAKSDKADGDGQGSIDLGLKDAPTVSQRELDLQAQLDALKAQAAEDKAIAEAKIKELSLASSNNEEKELDPAQFLEELVQVQLIKDNDKYKDDVVLGLNGEKIMIKRGVPVSIKRKFALILESSYRQQMIAADLQTEFANNYEANAKAMGQ